MNHRRSGHFLPCRIFPTSPACEQIPHVQASSFESLVVCHQLYAIPDAGSLANALSASHKLCEQAAESSQPWIQLGGLRYRWSQNRSRYLVDQSLRESASIFMVGCHMCYQVNLTIEAGLASTGLQMVIAEPTNCFHAQFACLEANCPFYWLRDNCQQCHISFIKNDSLPRGFENPGLVLNPCPIVRGTPGGMLL